MNYTSNTDGTTWTLGSLREEALRLGSKITWHRGRIQALGGRRGGEYNKLYYKHVAAKQQASLARSLLLAKIWELERA